MWLHKQSVTNIVALAFNPQYIAYAHIKKSNGQIPYNMVSYNKITLNNLELEKQIIFNPTQIGNFLHHILCEQHLSDADIRISLSGPTIIEYVVNSPEISIEQTYGTQLKGMVWEGVPIFQNSPENPQIYLCGISRELLFQYQLLAIKHKLNIKCITTANIALLNSYHLLSGSTNQSCTTPSDIALLEPTQPLSTICTDIPSTDNPLLMTELIGLCLSELTYENN